MESRLAEHNIIIQRRGTKMNKKFIVTLLNNNKINCFTDGERFFSIKGAKEYVEFAESIYPDNKGEYKIFILKEV